MYNEYSVHFGTFGCQNKINSTSFFSTSFHCNALVCIEHITMAEVKLIFSKKPLLCLYQFGIYRKESVERSSEKKYSKMQYIQRNEMQRRTFYTEILQYKLIQCLQCNTKQCKEGGWQQRMPTLPSFWRKKTVLREICWPARLPQLPNTISHVHGKRGRVQWNMWQSMLLPLPPLPPRFQEGIWGLRSGFWINRRKFTMQVSRHKQLSFGRNTFVNFPQLKW